MKPFALIVVAAALLLSFVGMAGPSLASPSNPPPTTVPIVDGTVTPGQQPPVWRRAELCLQLCAVYQPRLLLPLQGLWEVLLLRLANQSQLKSVGVDLRDERPTRPPLCRRRPDQDRERGPRRGVRRDQLQYSVGQSPTIRDRLPDSERVTGAHNGNGTKED